MKTHASAASIYFASFFFLVSYVTLLLRAFAVHRCASSFLSTNRMIQPGHNFVESQIRSIRDSDYGMSISAKPLQHYSIMLSVEILFRTIMRTFCRFNV